MVVRILSSKFQGLIPHETVDTELGSPMKLDVMEFAFSIGKCECVDTEARK